MVAGTLIVIFFEERKAAVTVSHIVGLLNCAMREERKVRVKKERERGAVMEVSRKNNFEHLGIFNAY